jgi:hypothetical protein
MMRCWEGKPSKLVAKVLPRKRVFVVNLTHDCNNVQFSSVQKTQIFFVAGASDCRSL